METFDAYYADYAEAKKGGSIERGWIPTFVPHSSYHLRETNVLDTNQSWLSFRYQAWDLKSLRGVCAPVTVQAIDSAFQGGPQWWPEEFIDVKAETLGVKYRFFHCPTDRGFLAVDDKEAVAFFWSNSG